MSSLNQVVLIGRLGADPEIKFVVSGEQITRFSVATEKYSKGKEKEVDWHSVTVFGAAAEACSRYLHRGAMVSVVGRISYSSFEKDGVTKYYTSIIANSVQFLVTNRDEQDKSHTGKAPEKKQRPEPKQSNRRAGPPDDSDAPF